MPETPDLDYIRAELDRELDEFDVDFPEPLPTDKYVAVSALQKAIRRGDVRTAHRATATVHLLDRRSFWRRTLVTAFEDIGIGDLVAVTQTTAAAERANWRAHHGDIRVGLLVVGKLARAAKCRATDLLYGAARSLPSMSDHAAELAEADTQILLDLVSNAEKPLVLRTLASMYAAGTSEERNTNIRRRVGCSAIWHRYQEMGLPQSLLDASQVAHRKLNLSLPVILPLVQSVQSGTAVVEDIELPEAVNVNGIPLYALDGALTR